MEVCLGSVVAAMPLLSWSGFCAVPSVIVRVESRPPRSPLETLYPAHCLQAPAVALLLGCQSGL